MFQKQKSEIKKELLKIKDENDLRSLLYTLLCKMNFERTSIVHGPNEEGKDIVCSYNNKFNKREWIGLVIKIGSITGGTKASDSSVINIQNQVGLSFQQPYFDSFETRDVYLNKVIVVTNGSISHPAQNQIKNSLTEKANIDFWDINSLVDFVYEHIPGYFAGLDLFVYEYYNIINKEFEKLNELKSFHYKKELKNLIEVFIEPTLVHKTRNINTKNNSLQNPFKLEYIKAKDLNEKLENIFIVGESGSGKSTLFRKLILEIIERSKIENHYKKMPILIRFKEIIDKGNVYSAIETCLGNHNINKLDIKLEERLKNKEVILFVDSLDELPNDEKIFQALQLLNDFQKKYVIKIIASSRDILPLNENVYLKPYKRLEILNLDYRQINKFLNNWFSTDDAKKTKLMQSLKDTEILNKLPKTPLVLTIVAILYDENEQEIPSNLTELYSMFTELLLGRWDSERDIANMYKYEIKDRILRLLAHKLHSEKQEEISYDELEKIISEYAEKRKLTFNSHDLIEEIDKRSQLIYKNTRGRYQFKHLSFQEYFTAKDLFETRSSDDFIIKFFFDVWWQEVIFFYCGRLKECPDIIKKIVANVQSDEIRQIIRKITGIGHILQAAYTTEHSYKVFGINHATDLTAKLVSDLAKITSEKFQSLKNMPRIILIDFFAYLFNIYFNSITLKAALEETFNQIIESVDPASEKFVKSDIYKLYFLANVLNELGDHDKLLTLSNIIPSSDLSLVFLVKLRLESITSDEKDNIHKKALQKINKKIHRWKKELNKELSSPIKN